MLSLQTLPAAWRAAAKKNGVALTPVILAVQISEQKLTVFEDEKAVRTVPCSTSRFGIGQQEGSNCTPLGLHRIAEKIGAGQPAGTVFQARQVVGHTSGYCVSNLNWFHWRGAPAIEPCHVGMPIRHPRRRLCLSGRRGRGTTAKILRVRLRN